MCLNVGLGEIDAFTHVVFGLRRIIYKRIEGKGNTIRRGTWEVGKDTVLRAVDSRPRTDPRIGVTLGYGSRKVWTTSLLFDHRVTHP